MTSLQNKWNAIITFADYATVGSLKMSPRSFSLDVYLSNVRTGVASLPQCPEICVVSCITISPFAFPHRVHAGYDLMLGSKN